MQLGLIILIILYPLLLIWQGLDFTDLGFMLTNFQQIFNDPISIKSSFRIWLTDVIGGVWVYFFGDLLGVLGYRIAGVLLAWLTLLVVYYILKPYFHKKQLLIGLLLTLIFVSRPGFGLNYNTLSGFFYALAAYFLIKGCNRSKLALIFVAGFVVGINVFIRLPNVLGFGLIAVLIYNEYLKGQGYQGLKEKASVFLLGFLASMAITIIVMQLLGHFESYLEAIKGTFSLLGDEKGHHSGVKLTNIFLEHYFRVVVMLGFTALLVLAVGVLLKSLRRLSESKVQVLLMVFFTSLVFFYHEEFQNWFKILVAVLGVVYLFLFLNFCGCRLKGFNLQNKAIIEDEFKVVSLTAILILILTPLGSNLGLNNSLYGMYLGFPIVLGTFLNIQEVKILNFEYSNSQLKLLKVIVCLGLVVVTLNSTYFFTYRETKYRANLVSQLQHERLRGVFTTKERAKVVQELLDVLPKHVQENDYLLAYEQIPLIYFLTKTRPYLYGSWPMLYAPERFKSMLAKAQREKRELPVIVRAKGSTEHFIWPRSKKLTLDPKLEEIRAIMKKFMKEKGYTQAWENNFFEIWTSEEVYQRDRRKLL